MAPLRSALRRRCLAVVPIRVSALLRRNPDRPAYGLADARAGLAPSGAPADAAFADLLTRGPILVEFWGPPSNAWDAASARARRYPGEHGQSHRAISRLSRPRRGTARGMLRSRGRSVLREPGWPSRFTWSLRSAVSGRRSDPDDVMPGVEQFRRPRMRPSPSIFSSPCWASLVIAAVVSGGVAGVRRRSKQRIVIAALRGGAGDGPCSGGGRALP